MFIDSLNEFADGVALNTGAAGTYNLGDIIDMSATPNGDMDLYLVIMMDVTATSGGSATGAFKLVSDGTSTISTTTATVHATTPVFAVADMTAGKRIIVMKLPQEGNVYERYLGIQQVTAVAAFTAGAVNAFLTYDVSKWKAYADAVN